MIIDDSARNIEISPCPFCGGLAKLRRVSKGYRPAPHACVLDSWKVECVNKCCSTPDYADEIYHADSGEIIVEKNGAYDAIIAWNTRK